MALANERNPTAMPRADSAVLFDVLNLLPHLLDDDLHIDSAAGRLEVLRLRRERVRFAVQLLHEEVEAAAGGLAAVDDTSDFHDVTREAIELFVDVEPLHKDYQLLLETFLVDVGFEFGEPLIESGADSRLHLGKPGTNVGHQRLESVATLLEQLAQPLSLAGTGCNQLLHRDSNQSVGRLQQRVAIVGLVAKDARPP